MYVLTIVVGAVFAAVNADTDWHLRGLHSQPQSSARDPTSDRGHGIPVLGLVRPAAAEARDAEGQDWCGGHLRVAGGMERVELAQKRYIEPKCYGCLPLVQRCHLRDFASTVQRLCDLRDLASTATTDFASESVCTTEEDDQCYGYNDGDDSDDHSPRRPQLLHQLPWRPL